VINDEKDSSIEAPTPNIFFSRFSFTTSIGAIVDALIIGFNQS